MALIRGDLARWSRDGLRRLALAAALALPAACATPGVDTAPVTGGGLAQIALQAPIGLPPDKTARLGDQLISALQGRGVSMAATAAAPARFKLQGFCSAADSGRDTSIACVWDATGGDGQRVQRIVTEETVSGSAPANPWSVVGNATLDRIAVAVADKVAAWLPGTGGAQSGGGFSLPSLSSLGLTGGSAPPVTVSGVTGAPGDGNQSLARAMASALRSENIPVTGASGRAFRLAGSVQLADGAPRQQSVTIEWSLTDPQGNARGSITQRNEVPRGALNGAWGETATASAAAAAKRVVELLPRGG
jgi:hypothetical protein